MKKQGRVGLSVLLVVVFGLAARAEVWMGWQRSGSVLHLTVPTPAGTNYQFQASTDLVHWHPLSLVILGGNPSSTQTVSLAGEPWAFFRVAASSATANIAPSDAGFTTALVGRTVLDYTFLSRTRFRWQSLEGNWAYGKTGDFTGKLVFTYDEDGNNSGAYREEIVLTFISPVAGSYRYSEFYNNIERLLSVSTGVLVVGEP